MGCCFFKSELPRVQPQSVQVCPHCHLVFPPNSRRAQYNLHLELCMENQFFARAIILAPNKQSNALENQQYWHLLEQQGQIKWEKRTADYEGVEMIVKEMDQNEIKEQIFLYRQIWLRCQLENIKTPWQEGSQVLKVKVNDIINSCLENDQFFKLDLKKETKIIFVGEKVQDAGGLLREFIVLLVREIFNTQLGLFEKCDCKDHYFKFNDNLINTNDPHKVKICQLLGYIMSKCLLEKIPLTVNFNKVFLNSLLGRQASIEDFATLNDGIYNQMHYLQLNQITDPNDIPINFQLTLTGREENKDGEQEIKYYQLSPGGDQIKVTEDNKNEYIELCKDFYQNKAFAPYQEALFHAMHQLIPKVFLTIFTAPEIDILLSGLPFIDVEDWKINTRYKGQYNENHQVIKWFWAWVQSLTQEQLAILLQFSTGSTRTPIEGFRQCLNYLKQTNSKLESNRNQISYFTIESINYNKETQYPKAHTCFNRLDLPSYPNEETLISNLNILLDPQFIGVYGHD